MLGLASIVDVVRWGELAEQRPDLAAAGAALLYQHGVGLGFLSTVRRDTGPRVHPICPLLTEDAVFAFIIPSPKQGDLGRDGRYAMHSFPCPENEDAFSFTGTARRVDDERVRQALGEQFVSERSQLGVAPPAAEDVLFEFDIERCLLTRTSGHGDPQPQHTVWRDPAHGGGTRDAPVFNQLNLVVQDMEAAVAFYRRLGLTIQDTDPAWEAHHRTVSMPDGLDLDLDSIAFARTWNRGWPRGAGMGVLSFRLPSRAAVDRSYAELTGAGYAGQQAPYDAFWGARFAIVEDPDGNAVGLMSPPDPERRGIATPP